jgi:hypothetical protein
MARYGATRDAPAVLNVLATFSPSVLIAVIAATAIKAAIKPYSITVAPRRFFQKFTAAHLLLILQDECGRRSLWSGEPVHP